MGLAQKGHRPACLLLSNELQKGGKRHILSIRQNYYYYCFMPKFSDFFSNFQKRMNYSGIMSNKKQIRRMKANCRERNRMHGLNKAMDILRLHVPLFSAQSKQKLSKIETLRLARNYIIVLQRMAECGQMSQMDYACQLAMGLSQTTANQIANALDLPPVLLANQLRAIKGHQNSPQSNSSGFGDEEEEEENREEKEK